MRLSNSAITFLTTLGLLTIGVMLLDIRQNGVSYWLFPTSYKGCGTSHLRLLTAENFPRNESARCRLIHTNSPEEIVQEAIYTKHSFPEWKTLQPPGQSTLLQGSQTVEGRMIFPGIVRAKRIFQEKHVIVRLDVPGEASRVYVVPVDWGVRGNRATATLSKDSQYHNLPDL
ncbi:hypothetical protein Spb1_33070 [Planctopirus ephydatiae]|uniref:Uncharacterized protein n=1 Tax=Planctopirus ephydatiae TaxID=2528019 RepID=A0A518GRZ3_9PLAN|nr:hypothetical protein [Planctopirus ephydatiae]QDV31363.1 hypothetical protein Spb1_33070 [Planctopirus ephydatiae]